MTSRLVSLALRLGAISLALFPVPALAQDQTAATPPPSPAEAPAAKPRENDNTESHKEAAETRHRLSTGELEYGVIASLLLFRTTRSSNESGRLRNYEPSLKLVPGQIGFQFTWNPHARPWRQERKLENGDPDGHVQIMSAGGALLFEVDSDNPRQGSLSLAPTLSFFNNSLSFGLGFDLYRGIPVDGADGADGAHTVYTGALAWAFSPQGEVTPENFFVFIALNLQPLVNLASSKKR